MNIRKTMLLFAIIAIGCAFVCGCEHSKTDEKSLVANSSVGNKNAGETFDGKDINENDLTVEEAKEIINKSFKMQFFYSDAGDIAILEHLGFEGLPYYNGNIKINYSDFEEKMLDYMSKDMLRKYLENRSFKNENGMLYFNIGGASGSCYQVEKIELISLGENKYTYLVKMSDASYEGVVDGFDCYIDIVKNDKGKFVMDNYPEQFNNFIENVPYEYISKEDIIGDWKVDSAIEKETGKEIPLMDLYGTGIQYGGKLIFREGGITDEEVGITSSENDVITTYKIEDGNINVYFEEKLIRTYEYIRKDEEMCVRRFVEVEDEDESYDSYYLYFVRAKDILLYKGREIKGEIGVQDVSDMKLNNDSIKKYNITYSNYENGKYIGETRGNFGEETYEGVSVVKNVSKVAMSNQYDAIPRNHTTKNDVSVQVPAMPMFTNANIDIVDLDGDNKKEQVFCYIGDYAEDAFSGIVLLDSNNNKIATLVTLENGFWGNIKSEDNKRFLSLDDVEYIDIDDDGIMEIIVEVPTYEGVKISILKYLNGMIKGETNLKASVCP